MALRACSCACSYVHAQPVCTSLLLAKRETLQSGVHAMVLVCHSFVIFSLKLLFFADIIKVTRMLKTIGYVTVLGTLRLRRCAFM